MRDPESTTLPRRSVDERGRALPMTEEEVRARAAEIARGLDALDDMGDEEEQRQTLDALMRGLDENPLSLVGLIDCHFPARRGPALEPPLPAGERAG